MLVVPKCSAFRWRNQVSERWCFWVDGLRVSRLLSASPVPHLGPCQATYPYLVLRVPPSREPKIIPTPKQRPSRPRAAGRSAGAVRSVMTIWAAAGGRELSWTRSLTAESPLRGPGQAPNLLQLGHTSQPLHPNCIPPQPLHRALHPGHASTTLSTLSGLSQTTYRLSIRRPSLLSSHSSAPCPLPEATPSSLPSTPFQLGLPTSLYLEECA